MIEISVAEARAEAILATPSGDGPWPGLRPRIQEMADRIAGWGFVVLAPNLFHREGKAAELAPTDDLRDPAVRAAFMAVTGPRRERLTPELAEHDLREYAAALRSLPEVAPGQIGVVGYCMGAALALRLAGLCPDDVTACAGFHGAGLYTDAPDSPHHALATARAEFVFGHAANDVFNPPEAIEALGAQLAARGLDAVNETYAGPHGFSMSDTASYDEPSAERGFTALADLLARVLR